MSKLRSRKQRVRDVNVEYLGLESMELMQYDAIFKPFMLVCQSKSPQLTVIALSCLGKLFQYNFWENTSDLLNLVIETVSNCFIGEHTDEQVQTQVINALSSAISIENSNSQLHGGILLKAVRIIYNIFLLSKFPQIQTLAQASLMQISTSVFNRVPAEYNFDEIMKNHKDKTKGEPNRLVDTTRTDNEEFDEPVGLAILDKLGERDPSTRHSQDILTDSSHSQESKHDKIAKDAYLLFRAFCKLSMKSINGPECATDLKSQAMRSKLLSLSLVYNTLKNYGKMFSYPSPVLFTSIKVTKPSDVAFILAVRQYICLVFTRNIVNIVPQVFDLAMDIFGRMLLELRQLLKKEISTIFTQIIIPIIEASIPVTYYQRVSLMKALQRAFSRPEGGKLLVELYLNYDCDLSTEPEENIWERLNNALAQVMTGNLPELQEPAPSFDFTLNNTNVSYSGAITTQNLTNYTREQVRQLYLPYGDNNELRKRVLELVVKGILYSLNNWVKDEKKEVKTERKEFEYEYDDPSAFLESKTKKQVLQEGVKLFNQKPKKAVRILIEGRVIPSKQPRHIAHFLLNCPGLDKVVIGEYLGEGEEQFIAIMHSFVDMQDFTSKTFVGALRDFLNTFRLPGEAQKIDRFMLKFADRYVQCNPNSFSTAETAYVLAYSVIMLNTDQYNPQVKRKMTCEDFVKNNRGINDGKDLPHEFLVSIFNEIKEKEIKMKDESKSVVSSAVAPSSKQHSAKAKQKLNRTESLLIQMRNNHSTTRDPTAFDSHFENTDPTVFYEATHFEHAKPMFTIIWMSCLMSVSSFLQKYDEVDTVITSLEGFKYSIHLASIFGLELEKKGFLTNLSKFVEISNIVHLTQKNIEAIKMLLEITFVDGNYFNENWQAVVKCMSQLEKIQQQGIVDPDPSKPADQRKKEAKHIEEMYQLISSQAVTLSVDRIFTSSSKLSVNSICHFSRALCDMSWDEIMFSSDKEHPRMYCLQRIIEISYYNINSRIRLEWTQIWQILGPHFNQVGCHSNTNIVFFCLDKLRQLSSKFLELEELPNFKFQKDFLRPFSFIFENNPDIKIKDMVLTCINNLLLYKPANLKSGWKTIFDVLGLAANEKTESIVKLGFAITSTIQKEYLHLVSAQNFYPEFVNTLSKFCQNFKFPKINAQAVQALRSGAEMQSKPVVNSKKNEEESSDKQWMVTFSNMKNIILTCELEVRQTSLTNLFDILFENGHEFANELWLQILKEIILPLFDELKDPTTSKKTKEDMQIWLSTTLTTAMKLLIELYTKFPILSEIALDELLDIVSLVILQENDTLARLGSNCLQEYVENNLEIVNGEIWDNIIDRILYWLDVTTPKDLVFDYANSGETDSVFGFPYMKKPVRKEFPKIITKCVLHLIIVQTVNRLFVGPNGSKVFQTLNSNHIYAVGDAIYKSYNFAKTFNQLMELRQALHQMGFMKTLPNLLKQETVSVSTYLTILSHVFADKSPQGQDMNFEIERRLLPLSYMLLSQFVQFDMETQRNSILTWSSVVESIIDGFSKYSDLQFEKHIPYFYVHFVKLLQYGHVPFLAPLAVIFQRVGSTFHIAKDDVPYTQTISGFPQQLGKAEESIDEMATNLVNMTLKESVESLQDELLTDYDPFQQ
ncbi:guanine nucleotide exchange protein for ADP-robosylation factor [Boothiomyces sp. JEL0838]|nr:guanine nucleotide exchange protein for ADP-robosylation factor [Boothiomyces sp. JEL0838]